MPATLFMAILFIEHAPAAASQTASNGRPKDILVLINLRLMVRFFDNPAPSLSMKLEQPKIAL
jgi:hypothetical protein